MALRNSAKKDYVSKELRVSPLSLSYSPPILQGPPGASPTFKHQVRPGRPLEDLLCCLTSRKWPDLPLGFLMVSLLTFYQTLWLLLFKQFIDVTHLQ